MLLASHNVKRLHQILCVALRKGAHPRSLLQKIESAVSGLYNPRGHYDDRELDVAFLAKALGGPRLLYALAHSHGLPSVSTLNRNINIPRLLPCISKPTEHEISVNIEALCDLHCKPSMLRHSPTLSAEQSTTDDDPARHPTTAGLLLMMDGVAIEERCRYAAERNSIIGLCREHGAHIRTRLTGFDVIQEAEAALHDPPDGAPHCHYGKDGTVMAIAPYARTDHYAPVPILVSASCKSERGEELAEWIPSVWKVWNTHVSGRRQHGSIWALGSDGESSFRRARFLLCMTELLDRSAPLGRLLRTLPGMNCYTGVHGICGTCDPKHVIKREHNVSRQGLA